MYSHIVHVDHPSFPGQEHVAGNSKIPSVIYYDKHGKMMAAGAEADTAAVISQAEDFGWIKTELYDSTTPLILHKSLTPLLQIQVTTTSSDDETEHERNASWTSS